MLYDVVMASDAHSEKSGLMKGRWIVLATLSLFIVIPVIVLVINPMVAEDLRGKQVTLNYAERSQWMAMPVQYKTYERGMMSAARNNEKYKDYGFNISAEAELTLLQLSRLALGQGNIKDLGSSEAKALIEKAQETLIGPDLFYADYLMGVWHELNNNPELAKAAWQASFSQAQAVILQRVVDTNEQPIAGYRLPPIVVAYDRIENDVVNTSLRLAYPNLVTDDRGYVYLPVYKTIYRVEPVSDLSQPSPLRDDWFTFPDQFGELRPIVAKD